jgi:hypothetical protein
MVHAGKARANASNARSVLSDAGCAPLCFAIGGTFPVSFGQFLNQWWNLPYLVMLGLVGVFFALQAIGMLAHATEHGLDSDAGGGAEADVGSTLNHEGSHELAHEHDADVDAGSDSASASESDSGADSDAESDAESGSGHSHGVAAFLGVGRVPFMVVWLTLFIFTGFTGLFLNRLLQVRAGAYRPWFFPLSLGGAFAAGLVSVRFAARAIGKLVDVGGRGASARRELRGALGVVASPVLDDKFGEVRVRDPHGNELIVHGHVAGGDEVLRQGDRVVLIELENESGLFHVAAFKE